MWNSAPFMGRGGPSGRGAESRSDERSATEQSATERSATEQSATEQSATERTSTEPDLATEASGTGIEEEETSEEEIYGKHFRFMCLNCYLIPPQISWNPHLWAPFWSCKRPRKRAAQIGKVAACHDLVCLQEVWGTNMKAMNEAVLPTHSILPQTQNYSDSGFLSDLADPIRFFFNATGGLWFAWRRQKFNFLEMDRKEFPAGSQVPLSNQNITYTKLDAESLFPGKRLIVYNTHFSLFGSRHRRRNLRTVRDFIGATVWKTYLQELADRQKAKEEARAYPSALRNYGVILCGDFNIDATRSPRSYRNLQTVCGLCKMRDLFLEESNGNYSLQRTYNTQERGYRRQVNKGNSLFPWAFRGRVDYVFGIDEVQLSAHRVRRLLDEFPPELVLGEEFEDLDIPVLQDGSLIITFERINCLGMDIVTQKHGHELSDHWPLCARLCIGPPEVDVSSLLIPEPRHFLRGPSICDDGGFSTFLKEREPEESEREENDEEAHERAQAALQQRLSSVRRIGSLAPRASPALGAAQDGQKSQIRPAIAEEQDEASVTEEESEAGEELQAGEEVVARALGVAGTAAGRASFKPRGSLAAKASHLPGTNLQQPQRQVAPKKTGRQRVPLAEKRVANPQMKDV